MGNSPEQSRCLNPAQTLRYLRRRLWFNVYLPLGIFTPALLLWITYQVTIRPMSRVHSALDWPAIPCTIAYSRVCRIGGIDILYRYNLNGYVHASSQYDFGFYSVRPDTESIVGQYHPGQVTICFVSPKDSSDAVLNRDLKDEVGIGSLFALCVIGCWGIALRGYYLFRRCQKRAFTA